MAYRDSITEEELTEMMRPKLRVFFSVDVVGSTAFKHESEYTNNQGWLEFFAAFYIEFPEKLNRKRAEITQKKNWKSLPEFVLWKSLGDELVFYVELSHPEEAAHCVTVFRATLRSAFETWATGTNKLPVSFKGTAWLAGFPVANAALPMANGDINADVEKQRFDFIGPQIDLGFRLTKFSSPRRLIISVELAALILKDTSDLHFYFEPGEPLRGVLKERRYPLIWIDCLEKHEGGNQNKEMHELEDELLHRKSVEQPRVLRSYCVSYIQDMGSPLHVPFVVGQEEAPFVRPKNYQSDLNRAEKRLREVFMKVKGDGAPKKADATSAPISGLESWTPPIPVKKKRVRSK